MKKIYLLLILFLGLCGGAMGQQYRFAVQYKQVNSTLSVLPALPGVIKITMPDGQIINLATTSNYVDLPNYPAAIEISTGTTDNTGIESFANLAIPSLTDSCDWNVRRLQFSAYYYVPINGVNGDVISYDDYDVYYNIRKTSGLSVKSRCNSSEQETLKVPCSFKNEMFGNSDTQNHWEYSTKADEVINGLITSYFKPLPNEDGSDYIISKSFYLTLTDNTYGVPIYFRLNRFGTYTYILLGNTYSASFGPSETLYQVTFYPSFPIPQTKIPIAPLCANGKGSISLSDFKYDDGTVYNGGENLSLTLNYIAGGIPDQTMVFTGTSISVTDLKPGNYKGQVTNASANCTSEFTFTIPDAPPALTVSITGQSPDCSTGTGTVTASAGGGTPPYQYALNGGANQGSNVFTGLSAGSYTLIITDANGCSSATSNSVSLTIPTAVNTVLNNAINPTGSGLSNGQIILSATGGTGTGYTYSLDGISYTTSDTFAGLPAGTYSATTKDSKGCVSAPLSITLTEPTPLALAISAQTNNDCYGGSDGSINVAANGGKPPYTYSINGISYQTSSSFGNLSAGSYTLYVKDVDGNIATRTSTVTQNADIVANINKTDAGCFGAEGTITIDNPTGGSGTGYSYSSDGGASYQSSNAFSLPQGTYTIKIKDANQCVSAATTVTINQPAASLQATATVQDAGCFGSSTGTITITATGGSGANQYSIDNWASSNTTGVFSALAAGTYEVRIKDQTNCSIGVSAVVNQPAELVLNIDGKTDAICFGGTGTIDVSSTGGQGNIVYSSMPALTFGNGVFSGALAGTYAITATDDNGCTRTQNVIINQPAQIVGSAVVNAVSCSGSADGKITLSATGGTGTYTYGIKSSGTYSSNNVFSGLSAGQYVFSIKDQIGCTADFTVDLTQPNAVALVVSGRQNVSCNGANNGGLTVSATGGSGSYTYTLNGANQGTNNSFSNLAPGNYLVRATDANGCSKETTETIAEPSLLTLSLVNKVDVNCSGAGTGEISVSASGGQAPYQYALNGGTFQNSPTFTSLLLGNHSVQVKDANLCVKTLNVSLTEPAAINASATVQNVKCFGDASGSIVISVSGGLAPYQYALNGASFQLGNTFSNLIAGNYNIVVRDKNNCQVAFQATITNLAPALALQATAISPSTCDGTGSISISSVSGGATPYVYSIDGNNYSSNQDFGSLVAGQYTVFVKDANGCIATDLKTISVTTGISAQLSQTDVSCFSGNDGKITVNNALGGNGNYLYSINNGAFQTSNSFAGLTAGNYSIVVKDNPYSCQYTLNATLTAPAKLTIQLKARTDISCKAQNDGKIEVMANGGTAPYQYSINGGTSYVPSGMFTALSANNYTLWVRDAHNCTESINVALTEPAVLALSLSSKSDVTCAGSNNGSLTLNAIGGTQPYRYAINGGAPQTSNRFDNLAGGSHLLSLTDANGCIASLTITINENPPLALTVSSFKNPSCNGAGTGEISLTATGGNGIYQYAINNGTYQSSGVFSNLVAGIYNLSVMDGKGCTTILSKTITEPSALMVAKTVTQQHCFDVCDGEIKLTVSGGTAPYTYSWSSGNYGNTSSISGLCGGFYKVTVTDANGCVIEDASNMVTPAEIKVANLPDTVLCVGQVVSYDAGSPGLAYQWTADNGFSKTTQKVQISEGGKYALKVTNPVGCSITKTFTVQTSTTLLKANFLVSTYANVGDTVIVVDVSKPTPSKTSWIFDTGTTMIASNASNTIRQVRFDAPGVYNMMMMVNLGQCADAVQKSITVLPRESKKEVTDALGYKEDLFTSFKIYPNPTNGEFKATIKLSQKSDIRLSMYGFGGNLVVAPQTYANDDSFEINFNERGIPPGIYVLTLEAGNQVKTLKIIKI
ncbi:hypothetical protein DHW03_02235 [Pedobacter yonginense]|uniref:Secretion system C-terminal sorting domain-containing protein n=1 Tax=Pedobacter yonginense TaxID=651869 RepID=A0A317ERE1_9SPHI|nr:T9SS type A sorting domain-containing protein [Pedobacter yonginense]PWS28687.1 hypothetical protein DHW03_02235 [Pedobacter yonginense]